MEVLEFAENLFFKDGIWFSRNNREISYPPEGNKNYYEIEENSFWFRHRNNCIAEVVKIFSKDEIFFDVGGGNGYVAKGLENHSIKTVLIEPGLEGCLNAKERGLAHIICSSFEDAGIKSNACKAIGLFDVVEHIEDDKQFLRKVNSILSEQGFLYITVPAYMTLWSKEDEDAGHYRRYTLDQLSSTLTESGLKVKYATYMFSVLPVPIYMFRTIPSLLQPNRKSNELNKHKREHALKNSFLLAAINRIWNLELSYIKQKKKIPFGSSCLVVAQKA